MSFSLRFPSTFEEAFELLDPSGAAGMVIAGGTDLLFALGGGRWAPKVLVSLSRLPLAGVEHAPGEVRIGSTVPLRSLELEPEVRARLPALAEACAEVGSVQLRHRATLGGNVIRASATSDLLPPLIALEARLTLRSRKGRRTVPVEGFVQSSWTTSLAPGEIIEDLRIPAPRTGSYRWQRVRPANDISQVGVAVAYHPRSSPGVAPKGGPAEGWRIVVGGTSPTVQRLVAAEARLTSPVPSREDIRAAAEEAAREAGFATDLRAAEAYRRHVVRVLVERSLEGVLGPRTAREAGA